MQDVARHPEDALSLGSRARLFLGCNAGGRRMPRQLSRVHFPAENNIMEKAFPRLIQAGEGLFLNLIS